MNEANEAWKNEYHFDIHTMPQCPWCSLMRHEMTKRGLAFEIHYHNQKDDRDTFKERYGVQSFPQVFVLREQKWTRIGGYTDTMKFLQENGL